MGLKSVVLESSDHLRISGFALATWSNAWRALEVLGAADSLRRQHVQLQGVVIASAVSGDITSQITLNSEAKRCSGDPEIRCVRRNVLLGALASDLPQGTIRFNSKVALIEEQGSLKRLHLADGSTLDAKVLVGCDGVNSVVAKWLGVKRPVYAGRSASRGIAEFPDGHGLNPNFLLYMGDGFRFGTQPCDEKHVYWFFTYTPSAKEKELEDDLVRTKQYVLSKLQNVPKEQLQVVERTEPSAIISSPLRFRWPWELLWGGGICKGNVCLAGDALHAMTPDLGQGGCSALEDGVTLARCLGEVFPRKQPSGGVEEEQERIEAGLQKYAKERKWRSFELICTAYVVGRIQQSGGALMNFLRDRWLASLMAKKLLNIQEFDCGNLSPKPSK